jgi:hypothetical protein
MDSTLTTASQYLLGIKNVLITLIINPVLWHSFKSTLVAMNNYLYL